MVFASPIFLFLFLPLTLAAYFALPRRWRNGVLLVASLAFYAWGEGATVALVLALGRVQLGAWAAKIGDADDATDAARAGSRSRSPATWRSLAVFKYANFAVANVNALARAARMEHRSPWPRSRCRSAFRSSRSTRFRTSSTCTQRNAAAQRSVDNFALYILLFPQLIAGPIIR